MRYEEIGMRAKQGFAASALRQMLVQVTGVVATVVLARNLSPAEFGLFGIGMLAVQFFSLIAQTGLNVAMVRAHREPTTDELGAAFTLQLLVTTGSVLLLVVVAEFLPAFSTRFPHDSVLLIQALALSGWLGIFRLVPLVLLERSLEFKKIAIVEAIENVTYNVAVVVLAIGRYGVWAMVSATVMRAFVGAILLNTIRPARIRLGLSSSRLRPDLILGLSFHAPNIIFFLKDLAMPTFLLTTGGSTQLGYFVWTRDFLMKFLTFSSLYTNIAFPTLVRLSQMGFDVGRAIRKSTSFLGLFYWPLVCVLIATSPFYIRYIFSTRWLPAQTFLVLFSCALTCQIVIAPWRAISQARSARRWPLFAGGILAGWDVLGGLTLIHWFGLNGCGAAIILGNLLHALLYYTELKRQLPATYRTALVPWRAKALVNSVAVSVGFLAVHATTDRFSHSLITSCVVAVGLIALNVSVFAEDRNLFRRVVGEAWLVGKEMFA